MPGNWPTLPKHRLFTQEPQILHQNLGHVLALQPWTVICGRKCFAILLHCTLLTLWPLPFVLFFYLELVLVLSDALPLAVALAFIIPFPISPSAC